MLASQQQSFLHLNGCSTASLRAVLDCLGSGVFLLNRAARVQWQNRVALGLVAEGDGLVLRGDRLSAQRAGENRRLAAALTTTKPVTLRITRPSGRPNYLVHAHPLDRVETSEQTEIALLVNTPEHIRISEESLMDAYQLTPAEARVALAVVHGDRLADAACRLRVSINTVKSTLQRVFAKTGTRTQAQLVRVLVATGCHIPGLATS